ncbi:MAG: thiamine diphosphokinase [Nanoarchaeota archaeon]|nr:thiamine diphosphokinase [Nanoarchaeota archaeon]
MTSRKANLILNGDMNLEFIASKLKGKRNIYCVDGAYDKVKDLKLNVRAVIGDMDSIKEVSNIKPQIINVYEQETTDFEKAIHVLFDKYNHFDIYGARGGQMDHFLGILSVAKKYKDSLELMFWDAYLYYFFTKEETILENVNGRTVSIMPFPILQNVRATGLEYPLNGKNLEMGVSESVRNKAIEDIVKINYDSGCGIVFVENVWK